MEIKYKNEENLYTDYVLNEAKSSKQRIIKTCIMSLFVIVIFGILMFYKYNYDIQNYGYLKSGASFAMLMYGICAALWIVVLPILQKRVDSMILISQGEEMGQALAENVKILLDEDSIIKETEFYKTKNTWKQVEKIYELDKIVVIKINGCSDVLVPDSSFKKEADKLEFIAFIEKKIGAKQIEEASNSEKQEEK